MSVIIRVGNVAFMECFAVINNRYESSKITDGIKPNKFGEFVFQID
jgi:hypothetical protein